MGRSSGARVTVVEMVIPFTFRGILYRRGWIVLGPTRRVFTTRASLMSRYDLLA